MFSRPCGVVVHVKELVQAESTHEILHELWVLRTRGMCPCPCSLSPTFTLGLNFDIGVYDAACQLGAVAKNYPMLLPGVQFGIDRYLDVSHGWLFQYSLHLSGSMR